jgi:hypothetical protein
MRIALFAFALLAVFASRMTAALTDSHGLRIGARVAS